MTDQELQTVDDQLAACEQRIQAAWTDRATAILEIRDNKLYRNHYSTFAAYCQQRWGFTKQRAFQLTTAAETVALLESNDAVTVLPANEAQVRPLLSLPAEQRVEAWNETVNGAKEVTPDGPPVITAKQVAGVVEKLKPEEAKRPTKEPPSQDVVDLRWFKKVAKDTRGKQMSGLDFFERFGLEALGPDTLDACKWFTELGAAARDNLPVSIPLNDGNYFTPTTTEVQQWQNEHPSIDVEAELRELANSAVANPGRRKTHKGVTRHIAYALSEAAKGAQTADAA